MAVSIGGILYSVGMNTSGYEAGAKKIESIEAKLRKQEKVNRFESAIEAKKVNAMLQEFELARMQYKEANAKLTESSTKEEIKAVEKLYKQYTKLGEAYDKAVANLKEKIQQNNFNIKLMKEEAEAVKATALEEYKLQEQRKKAIKTQRTLQAGINTLARATGIGTVAIMLKKFTGALIDAGEEASKLQDEYYKDGIFNPDNWNQLNQQLAKFGNFTRGASELFSDVSKSGLAFTATLAESLFTFKSISTILKENRDEVKRIEEEERKIVERKKEQKRISESIKQLNQDLLEMAERRHRQEEVERQHERQQFDTNARLVEQAVEARESYYWSNLSSQEQLNKLLEKEKQLKWDVQRFERGSVQYNKANLELTKTKIQIDKLQKKLAKEKAQAEEKAREKAQAEAKKIADKQKEIKLAREEFELQFKIAKLEKGNAQQQAQAEAIKNAIKRNELMQKYGYSIEQATRVLKAQKELENQGKVKYSEKDIERAQKIVKRSETNFVGEKTLAQAQAILNGEEIKGKRVSLFSNVKTMKVNPMQFANIPTVASNPTQLANIPTSTQSPVASAQATPTKATQTQNPNNVLKQILDAINKLPTTVGTQLKEVFSE